LLDLRRCLIIGKDFVDRALAGEDLILAIDGLIVIAKVLATDPGKGQHQNQSAKQALSITH